MVPEMYRIGQFTLGAASVPVTAPRPGRLRARDGRCRRLAGSVPWPARARDRRCRRRSHGGSGRLVAGATPPVNALAHGSDPAGVAPRQRGRGPRRSSPSRSRSSPAATLNGAVTAPLAFQGQAERQGPAGARRPAGESALSSWMTVPLADKATSAGSKGAGAAAQGAMAPWELPSPANDNAAVTPADRPARRAATPTCPDVRPRGADDTQRVRPGSRSRPDRRGGRSPPCGPAGDHDCAARLAIAAGRARRPGLARDRGRNPERGRVAGDRSTV
jgi:hypothetical protein